MENDELVSCLTVTAPGRLESLRLAVADFLDQDYAAKELIVVVDDDAYAEQVEELLGGLSGPVYLVSVAGRRTLGALRNIAIEAAHGACCCQWDDDDRYAPERLSLQIAALLPTGAPACFLYQQLHYFGDTGELFWTDWRYRDARNVPDAPSRIIPGTVLHRKDAAARYPEDGPNAGRNEDSVFARRLVREGAMGIETPPGAYLRTFHGGNTWDRLHHRNIAIRRSRSAAEVFAGRDRIEYSIAHFKLPGHIKVMAGDNVQFEVLAEARGVLS